MSCGEIACSPSDFLNFSAFSATPQGKTQASLPLPFFVAPDFGNSVMDACVVGFFRECK